MHLDATGRSDRFEHETQLSVLTLKKAMHRGAGELRHSHQWNAGSRSLQSFVWTQKLALSSAAGPRHQRAELCFWYSKERSYSSIKEKPSVFLVGGSSSPELAVI